MQRTPTAAILALAAILPASLTHAGPISPPAGPIVPTMKTLQQVEPRIPIGPDTTPGDVVALYKITQPGSYYLTGNITGVPGKYGIEIAAQNVTLDLAGFTLQGVPGSLSGIAQTVHADHVRILDGFIDGWGGRGVQLVSGGVLGTSAVHRVTVRNCAMSGFSCKGTLTECLAHDNGDIGFNLTGEGVLRDCVAIGNASAGFYLSGQIIAERCAATANGHDGFLLANHPVQIRACTAQGNAQCGIRVMAHGCLVENNVCRGIGTAVTVASGITDARIDSNHVTQNDRGIKVEGSSCFILRNTARANGSNYDITGVGNTFGPIVTATGQIGSANPWANFGN